MVMYVHPWYKQHVNQLTFLVFRTHQGSQQTIIGGILRRLSLNDTSDSMYLGSVYACDLHLPEAPFTSWT